MDRLTPHEITVMFLALATLLATARLLGELATRFNQPSVLGEILAGLLLGPTVLGALAPAWTAALFPQQGASALVLDSLITLAIALFLLVAGIEVDLSTIRRQGRTVATVGVSGMLIPFALGFGAAWLAPHRVGHEQNADLLIFALFFSTALSISALPVIAKTLMDLNLYRSDLGLTIIAASFSNDLIGWIIFAVILGMLGSASGHGLGLTIGVTLAFAAVMLTAGRWLLHRLLPWIQAHTTWPGGVLGFALSLALFGAAFTEWAGVHAVLGAFLVGLALGDSSHLREQTRATIKQFVSGFFAPLFFASIGLRLNYAAHFDLALTVIVLVIACIGKVVGCGLAARLSGLASQDAWAIGFGMNARGAMEIILGLLAFQYGLIRERMFVALVVMALVTSMISGPMMQRILRLKKPRHFTDYLAAKAFLQPLQAADRQEATRQLFYAACAASGLHAEPTGARTLAPEPVKLSGSQNGVVVTHAAVDGLGKPVVGAGLSPSGIDFASHDGKLTHMIFVVLTPKSDDGAQQEIVTDIARTFRDPDMRERALQVTHYTEFLALVKSERPV